MACIGIDLGGSSVKAVAVSRGGEKLGDVNRPFDPAAGMEFSETVRSVVADFETEHGTAEIVGLSAPGLAAKDGRSIAYLPNRLEGMEGFDWGEYLQCDAGVPVMNDAHAALLGEVWLGAAQNATNVILLTLGTGVGGAAMVEGNLLRGHTGKAGHLGHVSLDPRGEPDICGTPGSLEMMIGNCTIADRSGDQFASTHELIEAVRDGNAHAERIWLASVRALACAIGSFTNVLDPEVAVIGGGIARAGELLFEPLRKTVGEVEWKVCGHELRIVPAELGELAGAYGAAWNAIRRG
jgi:glucokinase